MGAERESWTTSDYARLIRRPQTSDHKGTRGRLLLVGGAPGLTGAVCLAADAALRAGAGYVTVAVPAPSLPVVEVKLTVPVKMALPARAGGSLGPEAVDAIIQAALHADAVVLGPGLGRSADTSAAVLDLIARLTIPLLLDADALFALGSDLSPVAARSAPTVLTPHAGEAARLMGVTRDVVDADRDATALALAVGGATALLKGAGTLIAWRGRLVLNPSGGPELATLGTGDVLAGIVGTLLAQGAPGLAAAALGAYIHGSAGEAAADDLTAVCCTAEDVVAYLPEAFRPLRAAGA
jgi:NAD(P)H-hydrate epimerase